eukprot:TRINITY_DN3467_c0_g1_i1.p1 TRINITY_DN3467_c0_g1~~TRINITY_DN3467_c0_g1_i1.p1  ORF type:complete len:344 (+),score=98.68 TRINITY_DN3467_c0_g1_i1:609-1640(+)
MILDTHSEVFVWVGQNADPKEKQEAFEIGQKYIERAALLEGLSPDTPLYKVTEGNEPAFFTKYFSWDTTKATIQGNSFEKKIATLKGISAEAVEKLKAAISSENTSEGLFENADTMKNGGPTQRAAAMAALNSAFRTVKSSNADKNVPQPRSPVVNKASQRAAAVAALSSVLNAEPKGNASRTPPALKRSISNVEPPSAKAESAKVEPSALAQNDTDTKNETSIATVSDTEESAKTEESVKTEESISEDGVTSEDSTQQVNGEATSHETEDPDKTKDNGGAETYSYEQLRAKSTNPAPGIDPKKRETYLSADDFQKIFGTDRAKFYEQPKWKQDLLKKSVDMF